MFHRARQRLDEHQARFATNSEHCQRVTQEFIQATSSGNVQRLLNLLGEDIVFVGDGGGKIWIAGLRPVRGRQALANG